MKQFILMMAIANLLCVSSCSKSDNGNSDLTAVITQGNWSIHFYFRNGSATTSDYNGYTFTFFADKTIRAVKGATITTGTWAEVNDSGKRKFIIGWTGTSVANELLELEEDWIVGNTSGSLIRLSLDSGSGVSIDELHFHKL